MKDEKVETWIFSSHMTSQFSSRMLSSHEFEGTEEEAGHYFNERVDRTFNPYVVWQYERKPATPHTKAIS